MSQGGGFHLTIVRLPNGAPVPSPGHWVASLFTGAGTVCFDIDLVAFDVNASRGFTGATPTSCHAAAAASGA